MDRAKHRFVPEQETFCLLSYNGVNNSLSIIEGLDKDHLEQDVTFENLRINGKIITGVEEGAIKVGEFTKNITFKNSQ